jgi:peptidyl-prolyl cis-trans isomerase B (cyclophilin B)
MPSLRSLLLVLVSCLVLAACGSDDETSTGSSAATPAAAADTPAPAASGVGCEKVAEPKAKEDGGQSKPKLELDDAKTYMATVSTSCGDFEITLDAEQAPKTGGSFVSLARKGFFDDLVFHRIVPGFVIQGGDPTGTGTGGPGYSVVEAPPKDLAYTKGVVAMAKTQSERPGTSGSQFFVVTAEDAQLPPEYALLGKVTKGMDVVDKISAVPTTSDDQPAEPVVIKSIKVQ